MSEKFTQGEWSYSDFGKKDNDISICTVTNKREEVYDTIDGGYLNPEEVIALCKKEADAKLISAAPSMYYLLRLLSTLGEDEILDDDFRNWIRGFLDRVIREYKS